MQTVSVYFVFVLFSIGQALCRNDVLDHHLFYYIVKIVILVDKKEEK